MKAVTLDDLIDRRGISLGELTQLAGVSVRTLFGLRRGLVTRPHVETIAGLAKALRVDTATVRRAVKATAAKPD